MVPVKNPGRQGLKTKLSTKTYWPAVYIVEHRIKNCSHFLHSPTGYEKTQREIAQEMYIWNAENYWKGVGLGILKISSRFYGYIFYFYENLDKKRPYFMYDEKKIFFYFVTKIVLAYCEKKMF